MAEILVVEQDEPFRTTLADGLTAAGHKVHLSSSVQRSYKAISSSKHDVIVIDATLLGEGKMDPVVFARREQPDTPVVVLAAPDDIDRAVEAVRKGAYLFTVKSARADDAVLLIEKAAKHKERSLQLGEFEQADVVEMVGPDRAMQRVFEVVRKVAPTDSTVLLLGESGVGKDVVAGLVHRLSSRRDRPFVALNCAALPETLLESELFGHVKGSFTGAIADKKGLFEEADGGTVFLDEIGDMALATQARVLRVLQNGEVRRVGDTMSRQVDVRVLAASNKDLAGAIEQKEFREDLYFRLNVIQLTIPPLRERMDALPRLARHFLLKFGATMGKTISRIDDDAQFCLANYHYPGNVRELENIIEHAVIMSEDGIIRARDLPDSVLAPKPKLALPDRSADRFMTLDEMEADLIRDTLARVRGNQTVAAKKLGISRSTLWRKLKKHNISIPQA